MAEKDIIAQLLSTVLHPESAFPPKKRIDNPNRYTSKKGFLRPIQERINESDIEQSGYDVEAAKALMDQQGELPLGDNYPPEMLEMIAGHIRNSNYGVGKDYDDEEAELLRSLGLL